MAPTIAVTDVDRSVAFYRQHLNFDVEFTNGDPVGFVILRSGAAELHLTLVRQHKAATHNVAHLLVDDAAGLYAMLETSGVRLIKGLRDTDHGLRAFVFSDPDGNRIDVGQRLGTGLGR